MFLLRNDPRRLQHQLSLANLRWIANYKLLECLQRTGLPRQTRWRIRGREAMEDKLPEIKETSRFLPQRTVSSCQTVSEIPFASGEPGPLLTALCCSDSEGGPELGQSCSTSQQDRRVSTT